jgi:hypothetical protein
MYVFLCLMHVDLVHPSFGSSGSFLDIVDVLNFRMLVISIFCSHFSFIPLGYISYGLGLTSI